MIDDMYWELLEEQHAHDVYVTWERDGKEEDDGGRPDKQTGGDIYHTTVVSRNAESSMDAKRMAKTI